MSSIRDLEPAPHIAGIKHFTTFAEVDEILRSKDFRQGSHQESQPFFGDSLLTIDHDRHFERRRLEAPLFRKAALEFYERDELLPLIDKALEEAADNRAGDGVVRADLCSLLRTMLARISAVTTGIDGVDTPERTDAFRTYVEQLGVGATVEWSTEDHDEVIARILAIRDDFQRDFYDASVERRRGLIARYEAGEIDRDALPNDLLTLLYLHWNEDWDDELPLREAALYLVASSQTTTHAVPHMMMHLTEWFDEHPEDRAKVQDKEFLKIAAHETLRLHLPSPALLRIAVNDVELSNGLQIEAGERVACLFTPANRDESVFGSDARSYNPYRDTGDIKPWGFAFGGGEHTCIGRTLVTGLSARTDNDEGTDGTLVNIMSALFDAGAVIDRSDPPEYTAMSHHDAYGRFPILLTNL
ncbi:MAG: cytochrome P450 [Acidimicrobiales bacterium]